MSAENQKRMQELLRRLETIEAERPSPEQASILAIAREAIIEELSRISRSDSLAVYRSGRNLAAVVI